MAPLLKQETALQILTIVDSLKHQASFRGILLDARSRGVIVWDRTLRRYLDLMLEARILSMSEVDVGSVHAKQLYRRTGNKPLLWTGPLILKVHGLNWEIPESELYQVETDLEATMRAKPFNTRNGRRLLAGLEDALVHEIKRDVASGTGTVELVASFLATQTVDLPYLFRRADTLSMGVTTRLLFKKLVETFTSLPGDTDGSAFLEARKRFLQVLRGYNSRGYLRLVEARGKGRLGLDAVRGLSKPEIVNGTAKQLGVNG